MVEESIVIDIEKMRKNETFYSPILIDLFNTQYYYIDTVNTNSNIL